MKGRIICFMGVVTVALLCGSCSNPAADFSVNGQSFKPGDTFHLENKSKGSDIFEWFLNENKIGNAGNLSYVVGPADQGILTFKLIASAEGKPASLSTKTVLVEATTGTVTVWSTFPGVEIKHVSEKNEEPAGSTSSGYQEDPGCAGAGCVVLSLAPGTHTIDGISSVTRTRRIVEVNAGECTAVKMH